MVVACQPSGEMTAAALRSLAMVCFHGAFAGQAPLPTSCLRSAPEVLTGQQVTTSADMYRSVAGCARLLECACPQLQLWLALRRHAVLAWGRLPADRCATVRPATARAASTWRSFGIVLWEIVTGEIPTRGTMRDPKVPDECPQVRWG